MEKRKQMLENEKIQVLLYSLSMPAIIGMLVRAMHNVIDTIFIGQGIGKIAVASMAIILMIQMLGMAVAQTISIGGGSLVSRCFGACKIEDLNDTVGNMFFLTLIATIIISTLGYIYIDPILRFFGASDAMMPYAREYMVVLTLGLGCFFFEIVGTEIIRAEGHANMVMRLMLLASVTNLVLDPFFIFDKLNILGLEINGLGMGMTGAALATILAEGVTCLYILYYFYHNKGVARINLTHIKLKFEKMKEIFAIGISHFLMQAAMITVIFAINWAVKHNSGAYEDDMLAIFSVIVRVYMLILMPLYGVLQGFAPIAGFNYGANNIKRVLKATHEAIKANTYICIAGFILVMGFAEPITALFIKDDLELVKTGALAMRVVIIMTPIVGFQMVVSSLYQAIGKARAAMVLAALRQMILLLPLVLILSKFYGITGLAAAFPISDFIAAIITAIMLYYEVRLLRKEMAAQ
ncbi:MAG: MATE family efflux transporter [Clostridia bacterium]|jgi:putative MATE family efflux protein|nr:MATE family efflux transporter [Clostridia bacterium]